MTAQRGRAGCRVVLCALSAAAFAAGPLAAAQSPPAQPASGGTISGTVLDAATGVPLARATVTLAPPDAFGVIVDARGASTIALARTVTTSAAGAYRFGDLPVGSYRLRFQRLGYEAATIDVRLGDSGTSPVSIGLTVLPVRLRPVEIHAHDGNPSAGASLAATDQDARLAAARARQHALLATDARELTAADVAESATLGGSDVFRALQRLPGVTQADDWSARLWVRGTRWDQDRVYFDDLPLFDPLGVLGRTAGVSANAIGAAFLQPGVRPVWTGGDGAARIDLRSRPAGGAHWRGAAEVSQFDANGAVERARDDGSAGFVLTGGHSLGHWLPRDASFFDALQGRTYRDADVSFRGDVDLCGGRRIETSGLLTQDARTLRTVLDSNDTNQAWSNAAGRVTFSAPFGGIIASQSVGTSHYASRVDRFFNSAPAPVRSKVDYVMVGGRVSARAAQRNTATIGYDIVSQRTSFTGTNESPVWGDPNRPFTSRRGALTYGSAWADVRSELGAGITLENGVRVDVGGGRGLDAIRPAASTQAAFALSPSTRASVGASRAHQYLQAIELPSVDQGQTLPNSWLTSGGDVPLMTIDNAMAGVEQWVGRGVLLAANVYARHTTGEVADDPTPGLLYRRPLFVDASESAHGVEFSARKLIGRTTGLLAYSYGRARTSARGLTFTAPADRTHALDAAASVHLGALEIGGAYTLTSGAPYTRTIVGAAAGTSRTSGSIPVREAPNAHRLPAYASLDASIGYTRTYANVAVIGFAGAQNLLGRRNVTWYEISGYCDNGQSVPVASPACRDRDLVRAPVRFAPTVGLRAVVR